ncbi:response regulator [Fibrobacterota bacterium]
MNGEYVKVLIIDDNPGDVVLIRETLNSQLGVTFHIDDGDRLKTGLEKIRISTYNIILLDLSLPDSQGLETFIELKALVRDIPIIVLTSLNNEEIAVQAVRKGAQDYLVKDEMNTALLVRSISYAIERSGAEEKRRWLELKMLHAQRLESLSVLSGGVAHNFNSLLTAIIGNAELAMEKLSADSSAYNNIQKIESSAHQAAELANQMLAYSGKGRFVVGSLNITRLVEDLKPIIQTTVHRKIKVHYLLSKKIPAIRGDVPQIQQLILNLVLNASEAVGENSGSLTLRTSAVEADRKWLNDSFSGKNLSSGMYACLEIFDNGMGIDPEAMPKIFDPFFTTKFTGRGLGLAAVQGIVNGHSGGIHITSDPGKGTRVMVIFPSVKERPAEPIVKSSQKKTRARHSILLVEEEKKVEEVTKLRLEKNGFKVLTADDQSHGLRIFKKQMTNIGLVILGVPGLEAGMRDTIGKIQKLKPGIKILLTSDYGKKQSFGQLNELNVSGIIKRPFRGDKLINKVRRIFEI